MKKEYAKYDFASFEEVNKELELGSIEVENWDFLNSVCRATVSKLNKMISYVTPFFIPGGYYSSIIMHHAKGDSAIHEETQKLYKELMVGYHKGLRAEMGTEKEQIAYFQAFWKAYPLWKTRILVIIEYCEAVFAKQEEKKRPRNGYLG